MMTRNSARLVLLAAATVCFWSASSTPAAAADYATGTNAAAVAVGDFNGDGKDDLAVANQGSNTVSVLLSNLDGTFRPASPSSYAVGAFPWSVAVGDFNGDGILDLAVGNGGSNTVSVLLGNGNGSFRAAPDAVSGGYGPVVAVGDFNGDGKADLAAANYQSHTVSVLLGNGDGTFVLAQTFDVGKNPRSIAVGHFNGDRNLDLVVANFDQDNLVDPDTISVFLGKGDGTFLAAVPATYAVGSFPWSVVVGDFNKDGKDDLAVTNTGPDTVSILLGNGDGTFRAPVSYASGAGDSLSHANPEGLAVDDVNGDGKVDLVVANGDSSVSVLLGNGDGTFSVQTAFGAGYHPVAVAVGDFNGDRKRDLAVANFNSDNVSVLLGNGDGTFPPNPERLTVVRAGAGSGTVQSSPTGIDCGATCSATYASGTPVILTATPASGSVFTGWTGAFCESRGTGPCAANMFMTTTVTATFDLQTVGLAVVQTGTGSGTVTSAPAGINCGTSCSASYPVGAAVTLTATPAAGSMFTGWSGGGCAGTGACTVTMNANTTVTAGFILQAAPPTFSPAGGTYNLPQSVSLSDATSGATIYYTTDGSTPTTSSTAYTSPISVTQTTTIKAIASAPGYATSAVATVVYTLQAAPPTFSPSGGNYLLPQSVSISDASPGVTIYYTTDGSTPTTSSARYTDPILVITTTTIKAIATAPGWSQSSVASATYTMPLGF